MSTDKIEKINLNDITNQYEVKKVETFTLYLNQVWKDLSGRDKRKQEGMDKNIFGKYYELPGLISERLFSVFDSKSSGCLSLNDFTKKMLTLFSSDFE